MGKISVHVLVLIVLCLFGTAAASAADFSPCQTMPDASISAPISFAVFCGGGLGTFAALRIDFQLKASQICNPDCTPDGVDDPVTVVFTNGGLGSEPDGSFLSSDGTLASKCGTTIKGTTLSPIFCAVTSTEASALNDAFASQDNPLSLALSGKQTGASATFVPGSIILTTLDALPTPEPAMIPALLLSIGLLTGICRRSRSY